MATLKHAHFMFKYEIHILPIFRMIAQEWCQNDNFIFTSCNFSYWKNFMLRFRMTYVHHSTWSGPVLFQTTRCTISHSHWIVGCHLTFDIFSGNLKKKKKYKTDFSLEMGVGVRMGEELILKGIQLYFIYKLTFIKVMFMYFYKFSLWYSFDSWVLIWENMYFQSLFNIEKRYFYSVLKLRC